MKSVNISQDKLRVQGFALVEVLVSVVVLALGILALLATQLRSVSSVREAETQTIAAQAAQNLIEGMLSNPELELDNAGTWTKKKYGHYKSDDTKMPKNEPKYNEYTLNQLALWQLFNFSKELESGKLGDMGVKWRICEDNDLSDKPEIMADGTFDAKCSGSGNIAIKIAWLVDPNSSLVDPNSSGVQAENQSVSYQTYLKDGQ